MWTHTVIARALPLLGCLLAVSSVLEARPSYLPPTTLESVEYAPTIIGHTVHSVPAAISHQSSTIVHEKRPYLRPIYRHAPVLRSYHPGVPTIHLKAYAPLSAYDWPHNVAAYEPLAFPGGLYDHGGWTPSSGGFYADGGWAGDWALK